MEELRTTSPQTEQCYSEDKNEHTSTSQELNNADKIITIDCTTSDKSCESQISVFNEIRTPSMAQGFEHEGSENNKNGIESDIDYCNNQQAGDQSDDDPGNEIISDSDEYEKDENNPSDCDNDPQSSKGSIESEDDCNAYEEGSANEHVEDEDDEPEVITFDDPTNDEDEENDEADTSEKYDDKEQSESDEIDSSPTKKRRRIILLSDDEDDDHEKVSLTSEIADENSSHHSSDSMNEDLENLPITIESSLLIENERPKPKCFKESTRTIKQLQAQALLNNAIIIHAPSTYGKPQKNKSRTVESDDEDQNPPVDTLDDIGKIGDEVDPKTLRFISERKESRPRSHSESSQEDEITSSSEPEDLETKNNSIDKIIGSIKLVKVEKLMEIKNKCLTANEDLYKKHNTGFKQQSPLNLSPRASKSHDIQQFRNNKARESTNSQTQLKSSTKYMNTNKRQRFTGNVNDFDPDETKKQPKIPDDIYYGHIQVPLHVLHSYSDDTAFVPRSQYKPSGSSNVYTTTQTQIYEKSEHLGSTSTQKNTGRVIRTIIVKSTPSANEKTEKYTSFDDNDFQSMKYFFTASGLGKEIKLSQFLEGCRTSREKSDKILKLLYDKGLEGKPSYASCVDLRNRLQASKEAKELDKNLIISPDARSTRRTTRLSNRDDGSESNTPPPSAVSKLIKIVDSDSE